MGAKSASAGKTPAKHFDYLVEYGEELGREIDYPQLTQHVGVWRKNGIEDPDSVMVGCRRVVEHAVCRLNDVQDTKTVHLDSQIDEAEERVAIDHPTALKLHEIRKKGNKAAHQGGMSIVYARESLSLLDDVLRTFTLTFGVADIPTDVEVVDDPLFRSVGDEEASTLLRDSRTATLVSGDDAAEVEAQAAVKLARESQSAIDELVSAMEKVGSLRQKMDDHEQRFSVSPGQEGSSQEGDDAASEQSPLFDIDLDELAATVKERSRASIAEVDQAGTRVQEVLNEHDFIRKLLGGDKHATIKQMEVMAFPRQAKTQTRILQIAGGAGTGKSLCLLAKLISEVDDRQGRLALLDGADGEAADDQRRALFICFNKGLKKYMEGLLDAFPEAKRNIDVVSFDVFFNQMAKASSNYEYVWLNRYAQDVRYPDGWGITYGNAAPIMGVEQDPVKIAMRAIDAEHPELKTPYYLDADDGRSVSWVRDELAWLEARYDDEEQAAERYPKAKRVGRGRTRLPNEDARQVILEVFHAYHEKLKSKQSYTIDQAVKRLLMSEQLPRYDAIAIDEAQDFALLQIKLILKLRRNDNTRVYIAGDEGQKIYQRDFTWKQLDSGIKGHTVSLDENKRNSPGISAFASRLKSDEGQDGPVKRVGPEGCDGVWVGSWDDDEVARLLANLRDLGETTAVIGGFNGIKAMIDAGRRLGGAPLEFLEVNKEAVTQPGLYRCGPKKGKGLEFDNVIVDYAGMAGDDDEEEKRLRYVHFTRPRKRLYVRYPIDKVPLLLQAYYPDFLPAASEGE